MKKYLNQSKQQKWGARKLKKKRLSELKGFEMRFRTINRVCSKYHHIITCPLLNLFVSPGLCTTLHEGSKITR